MACIKAPKARDDFRAEFGSAVPFKHIVFENLFTDEVLEGILQEFDQRRSADLIKYNNGLEIKIGTKPNAQIGPYAHAYFSAIHSGLFVDFLSDITGIKGLLPDPQLLNGGLHEIPWGGAFVAHVDFRTHAVTQLDNRLVFITYLNRDWQPAYGGALELWDGEAKECLKTILPEFGRSVLLYHSAKSWHGHSVPVDTPDKRSRKSVAAYYYTNGREDAIADDFGIKGYGGSIPLFSNPLSLSEKMKIAVRRLTPPILMDMAKDFRDNQRRKSMLKS